MGIDSRLLQGKEERWWELGAAVGGSGHGVITGER